MARNLSQLKAEVGRNGLTVVQTGREAKGPYEKVLREFYWNRDYPGQAMPPQLHPMLARNLKDVDDATAAAIWESSQWVAQEKIDGCRLLMFIGPEGSRFTSRRLSDRTYRYSENTEQLPHLARFTHPSVLGTVLDGEAVCSRPDVDTGAVVTKHQLQATVALLAMDPKESERIQREQDAWLVYKVFDILQYRGSDVTGKPYLERLRLLDRVRNDMQQAWGDAGLRIEFIPTRALGKKEFYEDVVRGGGEGVMLKDLNAPYTASSSRPKSMYKVKRFEELDLFVTGYVPSDPEAGWANLIGALELSAYLEGSSSPFATSYEGTEWTLDRPTHIAACAGNMTLEDRIEATACATCGRPVHGITENVNGKRVVKHVYCDEHGDMTGNTIQLNQDWLGRVFIVRGMEFTARVYRLFQARIITRRFDKLKEDCTIDLSAVMAKYEAKGEETGVRL